MNRLQIFKRGIQTKLIPRETRDVMKKEKELDLAVEREDVEELYRALQEPVKIRNHSKLSPDYLHRLHVKFENLSAQMEQSLTKRSAELSQSLARPTLEAVTELIHLNAKTKRIAEAQQAFDSISLLGLTPDLVAYNHLMHAYAATSNHEKVKELFEIIIQKELRPDLVSFSTFINSLIERKLVDEAFEVYEQMKSKGIKPNQIVFCTLIKGCLKTKQIERAWKTFDHLRSLDTPDGITYSLMINACAKTAEAEKALDLFQEMATYGITANEATYNGLIRACGSRPDYYSDSFTLMEQMIQEGFEPSLETYHNLFEITSIQADVKRARMIWNDFIDRVDLDAPKEEELSITPKLIPHEGILLSMIRLYTNARIRGVFKEPAMEEEEIPVLPEKVEIDLDAKPSKQKQNQLPILTATKVNSSVLAAEAEQIWELTERLASDGTIQMTGGLLAARLATICELPGEETIDFAYDFFKTKFKQYGINPMGISYKTLLRCAWYRKTKKSKSELIWKEFLDWDERCEMELQRKGMDSPMTAKEKEDYRTLEARQAKVMLDCFYITARGYCRAGDLETSIAILKKVRDFRHPYYLPPMHLKDIKNILISAQREADNGNVEPLQCLQDLIPARVDSVDLVQTILRRKYLPSNWWGWTAMGLNDKDKESMMRKHIKQNKKIIQREMELRRKGEQARRNGDVKLKLFKGIDGL
jgi:pentatricopeptide repeat protein